MAISKNTGSTKRFGSRYGRTSRHIVGRIEHTQRKNHLCPYCRKEKARRVSAGIWFCTNCNSKFTAKAYTAIIDTKQTLTKKQVEEDPIDETLLFESEKKEKGQKYKEKSVEEESNDNLKDSEELENDLEESNDDLKDSDKKEE